MTTLQKEEVLKAFAQVLNDNLRVPITQLVGNALLQVLDAKLNECIEKPEKGEVKSSPWQAIYINIERQHSLEEVQMLLMVFPTIPIILSEMGIFVG
jgi:hypothetical protein